MPVLSLPSFGVEKGILYTAFGIVSLAQWRVYQGTPRTENGWV